jgi:hypothetical protein
MKITNDIIKSSYFCLYKTYLKINGELGGKTEYEEMENEIKTELISKYILKNTNSIDASYSNNSYSIHFDAIEKVDGDEFPVYFSPNSTIATYEKEFIACLSFIINTEFSQNIKTCKIIYVKNEKVITQKVKIAPFEKSTKKKLTQIKMLTKPEFYLNKNCISCEFNTLCNKKATKENHLSLLNRVTPKVISKYRKKGIFTVNQLSYLYKPRRRRKTDSILLHNIELQALAIRTDKTYIKTFETINRSDIELFIDIESIPRSDFYYLFGVLLKEKNKTEYYSFWSNKKENQKKEWGNFLFFLNKYPEANIYHYGNFELKVFINLAKQYHKNIDSIIKRFINVNSFIYGKIYFPVYSNGLKNICSFLGVKWEKADANGLQSIVWRFHWDKGDSEKKKILIDYNKTDCIALFTLLEKIHEIMQYNDSNVISKKVGFIDNIKKQTTEKGEELHKGLETILEFAHENYDRRKMSISNLSSKEQRTNKIKRKGSTRTAPKTRNIVIVRRKLICPTHKSVLIKTEKESKQTITDMVFTKNTIRKRVVCYKGVKSYCPECSKYYLPPKIEQIKGKHFGYDFKSWIIYQRLYLRLPYRVIKTNLQELFNENISTSSISDTMKYFSKYYKYTEKRNLIEILKSPFIHADETKVNVLGKDHYVWVFTNGSQIYFRLTKTRENKIVKEILKNYNGVLISDFYPGYDALKCRQQKCWVHLLRDINDDLWKYPFDSEFESFVNELKKIMIPIFTTIERYGSKKRYLKKHIKQVEKFYKSYIFDIYYQSDIVLNYQKRLIKNHEKLFVFLEYNNIPWNNNMAERGLRQIAVQRKISTFFAEGINDYLLLLGIMQTCRFKKQSFLQFLISGKKTFE